MSLFTYDEYKNPVGKIIYLLIFSATYIFFSQLSSHCFVISGSKMACLWPVNGIAAALLLLNGKKYWHLFLWLIFAITLVFYLTAGMDFSICLILAVEYTVEPLAYVWLFRKYVPGSVSFDRLFDVLIFSVSIVIVTSVTSFLGAWIYSSVMHSGFWKIFLNRLLPDIIGTLLLTTIIISWALRKPDDFKYSFLKTAELFISGALLILMAIFVFKIQESSNPVLRSYTLFPLLIWLVLRFPLRVTSLFIAAVSFIVFKGTTEANGLFAVSSQNSFQHLTAAHLYSGIVVFTFTLLSAAIAERKNAVRELNNYKIHLESIVEKRTSQMQQANLLLENEIEKEKQTEKLLIESLEKEKESNELKARFISTTSHEFRTPLTSILSSVEILQRFGSEWSEEKHKEHYQRIIKSVHYLVNLLDEILALSKADSGQITYFPEELNLKEFCTNIMFEIKPFQKPAHQFDSVFSLRKDHYKIDKKLLKFILTNLLTNAFTFSPEGGKVLLSVVDRGAELEISVSDEGRGIPEKNKKFIFTPFFRADNSIDISGNGLGLSIVKKSVEIHKGKIEFESELNKGTKFTILLPVE